MDGRSPQNLASGLFAYTSMMVQKMIMIDCWKKTNKIARARHLNPCKFQEILKMYKYPPPKLSE